jgi:hypothetical protein
VIDEVNQGHKPLFFYGLQDIQATLIQQHLEPSVWKILRMLRILTVIPPISSVFVTENDIF